MLRLVVNAIIIAKVLGQICIIHLVLFILYQTWRKFKKKVPNELGQNSHNKCLCHGQRFPKLGTKFPAFCGT